MPHGFRLLLVCTAVLTLRLVGCTAFENSPVPPVPKIRPVEGVDRVEATPTTTSADPDELPENAAVKTKVYEALNPLDEKGFERMLPPKPGEWLKFQVEKAESFEMYRLKPLIRPTPERHVVSLQPLGEFNAEQRKVLEKMRDYAEAFFQLPARIEPGLPLELPADAEKLAGKELEFIRPVGLGQRREIAGRKTPYTVQFKSETILDHLLIRKIPEDAVVCLGITMEDLYAGDMNYVFGLGSFKKRVGVYSLIRYFPEFWGQLRQPGDDLKALRRACKVLNHETGHLFGLPHCVFFKCSMNGSLSLPETDAGPVHFCPVCQKKLAWNLGFDSSKEYSDVLGFYKTNEMQEESGWLTGRLERWKKLQEQTAIKGGFGDEPEK